MKKLLLILSILFISNCASSFTNGGIGATGSTISGDFKYIAKVRGEASSGRILLFFRLDSGDIYARAMADITNQLKLYDGSKKGLINLTCDYRYESFLLGIYGEEIVTVTADVVKYLD